METIDRELQLRTHVRGLLLQYALNHLATNYVTWTQENVTLLLSDSLKLAPENSPTSVVLPVDPLEFLLQRWGLSKLEIYNERWKIEDSEVVPYLRRQFEPTTARMRAMERVWKDDIDGDYEEFLLKRPMSPILTGRAMRETPNPGDGTYQAHLPQTSNQLLQSYGVDRVDCAPFGDITVNMDDVLGNKLAIDADAHTRILTLINSVPTMSARTEGVPTPVLVNDFLRSDSPSPDLPHIAMVPLFPRTKLPGRKMDTLDEGSSFLASLEVATSSSIPWLSYADMKEEEQEDLANEHLVVVSGWHAFKTPSSPLSAGTPSLMDASSDVDELFLPSSSTGVEEEFLPMEEYQIARKDKIGGEATKCSLPGEGATISSFLPPLLCAPRAPIPQIIRSPKSRPSSPRTTITMSMLGQPPSAADGEIASKDMRINLKKPNDDGLSSDDTITFAIKTVERACGEQLKGDDPKNLILEEKIDEKENLLLDIPIMRPPNEHPRDAVLPTHLADLIAPAGQSKSMLTTSQDITNSIACKRFLKETKGLQSLLIELSWIPFNGGYAISTHEEVADVVNDAHPQLTKEIDLPQDEVVSRLAELLDKCVESDVQLTATVPEATLSMKAWSDYDEDTSSDTDYMQYGHEPVLILTQRDRRRLSGLPSSPEEVGDAGNEEVEGHVENDEESDQFLSSARNVGVGVAGPSQVERPLKRVRFQDEAGLDDDDVALHGQIPAQLDREDSGVFLGPEYLPSGDEPYSVTQLAYCTEGLEGSTDDGDLFPDLHSFYFSMPYQEFPFGMSNSPAMTPSRLDANNLIAGDCEQTDLAESMTVDPSACELTRERRVTPLHPIQFASLPSDVNAWLRSDKNPDRTTSGNPERSRSLSASAAVQSLPVSFDRQSQSLAHFLAFCGKGSLLAPDDSSVPDSFFDPTLVIVPDAETNTPLVARSIPAGLFDAHTLILPAEYKPSSSVHRYIASMELIQKRALVRALSSQCAVELVEREHLGEIAKDVHLILDCDTAVVFAALETLPTGGHALATLLSRLSWCYSHLLVIFQCYPSCWDHRGDIAFVGKPVASVWSVPVTKAIHRLRRELAISEGMQTKCAKTVVNYAFANSVKEAAAFARMYGNTAEGTDETGGAAWGDRPWLSYEEHDGEYDLCGVDGMNLFAASLLLSQTTLEAFLEKTAEERLLEFGEAVGPERIARFNAEMARRQEAMQLPPSSPIDIETSSSSNSVPYIGDSEPKQ